MKQVKEMVEIAGRELAKPRAFPVPLKEFLRIVDKTLRDGQV